MVFDCTTKMSRIVLAIIVCFLLPRHAFADDDILVTRDGAMTPAKIEQISTSQVLFVDLKHKRRGRLSAPANFVYMIIKEKGNNVFFDEEGNQTTSPAVKYDKDDNIMFLNSGRMFVVYNVSVGKEEISYKLKDKKKAPLIKIRKADVFMLRYSDGTTTLYNDSYRLKQAELKKQKDAEAKARQKATLEAMRSNTPRTTTNAMTTAATAATAGVAGSQTTKTDFFPAPQMNPDQIQTMVKAAKPYTLYGKGTVAEYCFEYKGNHKATLLGGPTYFQQIVSETKVENGLLVAYIRQACLNKKHEPSKGISASFKNCIFPVEIDTAGTYHLTHNLTQDILVPTRRRGYGILIPNNMYPGMELKCSTLYEDAKNLFGGTIKVETVYKDWKVESFENIDTPAGSFDCVKLTGHIESRQGRNAQFTGKKITCWMTRGIGIVRYEEIADNDKSQTPFITYLNSIDTNN